jgi:hypothetical protein
LLDIKDAFDFDALFFEGVSQGLLNGRINQKLKRVEILSVKARDFIADITDYRARVSKWIDNIKTTEKFLDDQMQELRTSNTVFNEKLAEQVSTFTPKITSNK